MAIRDEQDNFLGSKALGDTVYEYDYFCLAENECILVKKPNNTINLCYINEINNKDKVLSINKNGQQEWKSIKITKHLAPDKLKNICAGNTISVTNNHKLFRPEFEIEAAGNLSVSDPLMSVRSIYLPETRTNIILTDYIKKPKWLLEKENTIGHYAKHPINSEVYIPNNIKLNSDFGLIVGLYLAEGSTAKNIVQYAFHLDEFELSNILSNALYNVFGVLAHNDVFPEYTRRTIRLFNKTLAFIYDNLLPGNSHTKYLPNWCFDAPIDFKKSLLAGWLLGDGGSNHGRTIRGTSVSKKLIQGMHNIALSLGIPTSIVQEKTTNRLYVSSKPHLEKIIKSIPSLGSISRVFEYLKIRKNQKAYTIKQLSSVFLDNYINGMTCIEFCNISNISLNCITRVFGNWNGILKYHNKEEFILKNFITKKELIIIGWNWLQNNSFSESKWDNDKTLPSTRLITKYFRKSSVFVNSLKALKKTDIDKLQQSKENINKNIISTNIKSIKNISYNKKYVYDITVEDNENFLIGNILSHNSGSQIVIMIGDVVVDAAVGIQFSVDNSKTPVYGYANQYYTFTTEGKVLVQGSLTIAFKESSYMLYPTQRFVNNFAEIQSVSGQEDWQKSYPGLSKSPRYSLDSEGNLNNTYTSEDYTLTEASKKARRKEVMRANVEQMFAWDHRSGPGGQPRYQQKYNNFWQELGALPDKDFEDYAEAFEDAIWYGSDTSNPLVRDKLFSKSIPSGQTINSEELLKHRRLDQYPEIDIWIVYGDMTRQPANHTVKKLLDVSFVGQSQVIQIDGNPTFEQYSFFARNLV